jgi:hypothetical protein
MIVIDMLRPAHFHVCLSICMYFPGVMIFPLIQYPFLLFDWEQLHLFCHAHCNNNASYRNNLHLIYH